MQFGRDVQSLGTWVLSAGQESPEETKSGAFFMWPRACMALNRVKVCILRKPSAFVRTPKKRDGSNFRPGIHPSRRRLDSRKMERKQVQSGNSPPVHAAATPSRQGTGRSRRRCKGVAATYGSAHRAQMTRADSARQRMAEPDGQAADMTPGQPQGFLISSKYGPICQALTRLRVLPVLSSFFPRRPRGLASAVLRFLAADSGLTI